MLTTCKFCNKEINRKPSEIINNIYNFCSVIHFKLYRKSIINCDKIRVMKFIKSSWTNMNIRGIRLVNNKWLARITIKSKEKHLGSFTNEEEALTAFKEAYIEYYNKDPWN